MIDPDEIARQHCIPAGPAGGEYIFRNIAAFIQCAEELSALAKLICLQPVLDVSFLVNENQIFLYGERIGVQSAEQIGERFLVHRNDNRLVGAVPIFCEYLAHIQQIVHRLRRL